MIELCLKIAWLPLVLGTDMICCMTKLALVDHVVHVFESHILGFEAIRRYVAQMLLQKAWSLSHYRCLKSSTTPWQDPSRLLSCGVVWATCFDSAFLLENLVFLNIIVMLRLTITYVYFAKKAMLACRHHRWRNGQTSPGNTVFLAELFVRLLSHRQ